MTLKSSLTLLVFAFTLYDACSSEVLIGDDILTISAPNGFVDVSKVSEEELKYFENVPQSTRFISAYISASDAGRSLQGLQTEINQYFIVNVHKTFENESFTKSEFAQYRMAVKEGYDKFNLDQMNLEVDELEKLLEKATSEKLGEKQTLY